jgi:hypothetical protein
MNEELISALKASDTVLKAIAIYNCRTRKEWVLPVNIMRMVRDVQEQVQEALRNERNTTA